MSSDGTEAEFYAIQCSNCLAKLKVRNAPIPGKKITCPKCKESFIVGEQEAIPSKPAPKKQAPPPVEDDEEELGLPKLVSNLSLTNMMHQQRYI
jgi:hypothetical protein